MVCIKQTPFKIQRTNYSSFHKLSEIEEIPLKFPKLNINNLSIKMQKFVNFLGDLLVENLNWKEHIRYTGNQITKKKKIELLFKAKPFLNRNALLPFYYSFLHTYITYANVGWGSTCKANLKKSIVIKNMHCLLKICAHNRHF